MKKPRPSAIVPLLTLLAIGLVSGGSPCGPSGNQCIEGQAACTGGTCVCANTPYAWGDGYFSCYRKNQVAAELRNDPSLTTFNNETVNFPYPCRYLITHVQQELKTRDKEVIGQCEIIVHGFNRKNKGKFYVHGFDVAVRLTYNNGEIVEVSGRKYGTAANGVNTFVKQGTFGSYLPDGPWGSDSTDYVDPDPANGVSIRCEEDPDNNRLLFRVKRCGLCISFVPYDTELRRRQAQIPGLSVAINCAHHPVWKSLDRVMGLPPTWQGGQLLEDIVIPGLDKEESVVARAFESDVEQNHLSGANGQCNFGKRNNDCSDDAREKAYEACFWILKFPKFINCMDQSDKGSGILVVFNLCVLHFCHPRPGVNVCQHLISKIVNDGCGTVPNIPALATFLSGIYCD